MRSSIALSLVLLGSCAHDAAPATTDASTDREGLRVFHCDEGQVVLVRPIARGVDIGWGDRRETLMRIAGLTDEIYVGGGFTFERSEDEATLDVGPRTLRCERGAASRRLESLAEDGVRIYAAGSEPFWWLTIGRDRFVLEQVGAERSDDGAIERVEHRAARDVYAGTAGDEPLRVDVERRLCHDGMSGAPFPAEVVVRLGAIELRGCGVFLEE